MAPGRVGSAVEFAELMEQLDLEHRRLGQCPGYVGRKEFERLLELFLHRERPGKIEPNGRILDASFEQRLERERRIAE